MEKTTDRFESPHASRRVGAHRANPIIGSKRVWFLFAFLITLLLSTIGVIFIQLQPGNVQFSQEAAPSTAEAPKVQGELNPEATVAVLNGTDIVQLASFVDEEITKNNWGTIVFSGDGDMRDVTTSAVFYADVNDESAAIALGEMLGGVKAYLGAEYVSFDNMLTVVLGADYKGPGAAQAQEAQTQGSLTPEEGFEDEYLEDEYLEEEYFEDEFVEEEYYEGEIFESEYVEQELLEEENL